MVYVINQDKKPLMPCSNARARLLLKKGYAKVIKKCPFTVKLEYYIENPRTKELTLGIDTGSAVIGSAVTDNDNNVFYQSEIQIRNDIKSKMDQRRMYRRTRRNRKTRYRKPRFLNRRNSIRTDRFSPTMISKFNSHHKEIRFVNSILPVTRLILETATFDPHLMKDPTLNYKKWGYTKGEKYGFSNNKEYVKYRDSYTCKICKKTKVPLEVHHIVYRSNKGTDLPENLITLCKDCHEKVHLGLLKINKLSKSKNLKHATQMNSIRVQLLKYYSDAIETFGYITKEDRYNLGITSKTHSSDAIAISCLGKYNTLGSGYLGYYNDKILYKKCVPYRDYQKTKGKRSEKLLPTGKIFGFRKFDKVLYRGKEYFIKGRRTAGTAELMDIFNNNIKFTVKPLTPKLINCIRLISRKSWIIQEEVM